ncbi:MAG: 30S ribosomal protein S2 [Nanoarchaeota archaeon]|nr:30S ribosomal protein S2 [Nanoarchaeota archaeon]
MAFEEYLSNGMHIGMKKQTSKMKRFVYKTRDDGLAVLDLQTIDDRIKMAAKFLAGFNSIMVVSRKPVAKKAITKFAELIDARAISGRFLPGIITNPSFRAYYEPDVLLITDPATDSQAIDEAIKMRVPIVSLVDTFNEVKGIDFIIPVNNKGRKSIAATYYILAREILKCRGKIKEDSEFELKLEDFAPSESSRRTERSDRPRRTDRFQRSSGDRTSQRR